MDLPRSELPAVAGLPAQRPPLEPAGAAVLRSIGFDALVDLVEGSPVAVGVTAQDRWVYLNPAGRRLLGPDEVRAAGAGSPVECTRSGPVVRVGGEELALVVLRPAPVRAGPDAGDVGEDLRRRAVRDAAEQERQRLGRDLHDSVSSALFALHTRTQVVDRALAAGDLALLAEAAKDMQALSGQAIAELRALVSAMREDAPAAAAGNEVDDLPAALEQLAARTLRRDRLEVELRLVRPLPAVPPATAEHLVRIAAEAVHNCLKHAGASRVRVGLEVRGSELVLEVSDEGFGFDASAARGDGHGQRTMRERAVLCGGWLHVDTAPGRGTRVVARVPLPG
jgi:signal transduction histidine kinase